MNISRKVWTDTSHKLCSPCRRINRNIRRKNEHEAYRFSKRELASSSTYSSAIYRWQVYSSSLLCWKRNTHKHGLLLQTTTAREGVYLLTRVSTDQQLYQCIAEAIQCDPAYAFVVMTASNCQARRFICLDQSIVAQVIGEYFSSTNPIERKENGSNDVDTRADCRIFVVIDRKKQHSTTPCTTYLGQVNKSIGRIQFICIFLFIFQRQNEAANDIDTKCNSRNNCTYSRSSSSIKNEIQSKQK